MGYHWPFQLPFWLHLSPNCSLRRDTLLPWDVGALTSTGLGLHDLQQENNDGQQVGDIPQDAEDVHGAGETPLG